MSHSNVSPERDNLFLGSSYLIVTDVHLLEIKAYRFTCKCDAKKCTPLEAILCIPVHASIHHIDKKEVAVSAQ
jgi:hypothetical protein